MKETSKEIVLQLITEEALSEEIDVNTKVTNEDSKGIIEQPIELKEFLPKRHSVKIATLAIFSALGVALSSLFIYLPYVEFISLTLFIGGVILGPLYGSLLAVISTSLYEIISTAIIGPGFIVFPFKLIGFLLITLAGAFIGQKTAEHPSILWRVFIGVVGGILTIFYDLIVNIGWILLSEDFQLTGYFAALLIGLPVTASRVAANVFLFSLIPDILNRAIKPLLTQKSA